MLATSMITPNPQRFLQSFRWTSLRAVLAPMRAERELTPREGGTYNAESEHSVANERELSGSAPVSGPSLQKLEMLEGSDERGGREVGRSTGRSRESLYRPPPRSDPRKATTKTRMSRARTEDPGHAERSKNVQYLRSLPGCGSAVSGSALSLHSERPGTRLSRRRRRVPLWAGPFNRRESWLPDTRTPATA